MSEMASTKPYRIAKRAVWEAYQLVKANRGAAGVDDETIPMFEQNLSGNLYKLWNRMSSGSYFPPPVKQVEIPKAKGGTRRLGVPTVSDRIAQTVVKLMIEPIVDPVFHEDSYGYRPGKSAKQAIAETRKRCWPYDWVVEFDIKGRLDPRRLRETGQELLIALPRVASHDTAHCRVRLERGGVNRDGLAPEQSCRHQPLLHPREDGAVALEVDDAPRPGNRRMIGRRLGHHNWHIYHSLPPMSYRSSPVIWKSCASIYILR